MVLCGHQGTELFVSVILGLWHLMVAGAPHLKQQEGDRETEGCTPSF